MSISLSFSKQGGCKSWTGLCNILPDSHFVSIFEHFDRLPKDVQFIILRHLHWTNLLSCKVVSRSWLDLIRNPMCWKDFSLKCLTDQHQYTPISIVCQALHKLPFVQGFECDIFLKRSKDVAVVFAALELRCKDIRTLHFCQAFQNRDLDWLCDCLVSFTKLTKLSLQETSSWMTIALRRSVK